jgi:dTDP-4-dehydrorhamnose reductase
MATPIHILVTGANGQLGMELADLAKQYPEYRWSLLSRKELSITDAESVQLFFEREQPDYCINTAAYTAVDLAETETEQAMQANAWAVEQLAACCKQFHCRFLHISTDYVFNGKGTRPYLETDPTEPQNVYGISKCLGEEKALAVNPDALIVRTSWVYSIYGKNFVKTMLRLMKEREEISVVNDQQGSPTYAADLATALFQIIDQQNFTPGIYHFSNQGITTWYEFACTIKELANLTCRVMPVASSAFPTPAKRPSYSVMDTRKFQDTFQQTIPDWKTALQRCLHAMPTS